VSSAAFNLLQLLTFYLQVFFGHLTPAVEDIRYQHQYHPQPISERSPALQAVIDLIADGQFGDGTVYEPLLNTIRQHDHYLVSDDFESYLEANKVVDDSYQNDPIGWIKKSITTTAKMGKFSSDRAIMNYADEIWNVEKTASIPSALVNLALTCTADLGVDDRDRLSANSSDLFALPERPASLKSVCLSNKCACTTNASFIDSKNLPSATVMCLPRGACNLASTWCSYPMVSRTSAATF